MVVVVFIVVIFVVVVIVVIIVVIIIVVIVVFIVVVVGFRINFKKEKGRFCFQLMFSNFPFVVVVVFIFFKKNTKKTEQIGCSKGFA